MNKHIDRNIVLLYKGKQLIFDSKNLPIEIGDKDLHDIYLENVNGFFQIGFIENNFFIQPNSETKDLLINDIKVTEAISINNRDIISFGKNKIYASLENHSLYLDISIFKEYRNNVESRPYKNKVDDIIVEPINISSDIGRVRINKNSTISKSNIFLYLSFFFLGFLAWFAFTSKSIELVIEPHPDSVYIPDTFLKFKISDRYLLQPGKHKIEATLNQYYDLDTEIIVDDSQDQSFFLSMDRLPGIITLKTNPAVESLISLNGNDIGISPISNLEIPTGTHSLEILSSRYLPKIEEIEILGGGSRQEFSFNLVPNWSEVAINSEPISASVFLDNQFMGITPIKLEIVSGEHILSLDLSGYNQWSDRIFISANKPQSLPLIELEEAKGVLEIATEPNDVAININGNFVGRSPIRLNLPPKNDYEISLSKPGYQGITALVPIEGGIDNQFSYTLTPLLGLVSISSNPSISQVFIDGNNIGSTPLEVELMSINHKIEIRQDGYRSEFMDIVPTPGYKSNIDIDLEILDPITGSGYEKNIVTSLGQNLVLIPPRDFQMGSSRREQGRRSNETLRSVKISKAFYLGTKEVTNFEYRQFKQSHDSGEYSGISLNLDEYPVVRLTWEEAVEFLNWLSIRDGLQPVYEENNGTWTAVIPLRNGYRLPTEAEWTLAAKFSQAESPIIYSWGNDLPPPDRSGNFADISANKLITPSLVTYNDSFQVLAPPGSFSANNFGIFDLGGNVTEWIHDYWEIPVSNNDITYIDPLGPEEGSFHVIRGSSWKSATITDLRLSFRYYEDNAREDLGFRIARNLE